MSFIHSRGISCALMALVSSNPAHAEDQQRSDIIVTGVRDGYVPKDSSAAKIALSLRDVPQSIAVVPAEVLRDQRALSLQDALKNVPGVSPASGDGQRDEVRIRGFTAIADQFVDGFRDDALYFRDLSNIDRIEVIKGLQRCCMDGDRRVVLSIASPKSPTAT